MDVQIDLSAGRAACGTIATLLPSGVYAVITEQTVAAWTGVATGVFFAVWTIYRMGADAVLSREKKQHADADKENDRLHEEISSLKSDNQALHLKVEELLRRVELGLPIAEAGSGEWHLHKDVKTDAKTQA
jgi:hypothetical protein